MASGPTQNYDGAEALGWRPRPVLARLVRAAASFGPVLFALAVGAVAARWAPASRIGVPGTVWLLLVVVLSSLVLVLVSHLTRRLVPLSALLRLSLVLPDRVPSRFDVARRTWSPSRLQQAGPPEHDGPVDWLLALVGSLAEHDARTRAHGERVQAYAALIGAELGLSREDVDRLSWAALLHDVGKVHVPVEVINKKGRPDDEEWASLQQHPAHGGRLVEPLRGWLGPWLDGVEQHHERFDGAGYPRGLHGTDISLAARVIAVADTYDVITSARSYKKPLSAEQARAEITRCAGAQFDPDVVRAFLTVGVGRLRLIAGPATLLAALPGVGSLPAQAVSNVSAVAHTVGGQVLGAVLTAGVGVGAGFVATDAAAADPVPVVAAAPFSDVSENSPAAAAVPSPSGTPTTSPSDLVTFRARGTDPFTPIEPLSARTPERSVPGSTAAPVALAATASRPETSTLTATPTATRSSTSPGATARPTQAVPTATAVPSAVATTPPTPTTGNPVTATATTMPTAAPSTTATATSTTTATAVPTTTPTTTATAAPTSSPPTSSPPTSSTPTSSTPTSSTPTSSTPTSSTPTTTPVPTPTTTDSCSAAHHGATRLEDKDLRGCDLQLQTLTGNWRGAKLQGANLTGATLLNLDLSHTDLRTADLDLTRLVAVDLSHADLRGTSFRGAVLTGVDLTQAKWDAHTFDGAVLVGVTGM
ncbi:HD domain-containing phosphohydrolase [Kineococcus sp. R86509]|uniref:HD domain-containing phosphohydrolase n=1 Tax=Kineococcus sp. R86509 TaxID=3093851 RepID=UPI0036D3845C